MGSSILSRVAACLPAGQADATGSILSRVAACLPGGQRDGLVRYPHAAVLVTDMSGFTSRTRKMGIVHFASLILRMRQLCLPIMHAHGALFVATEADNLIVILPTALAAAKAACEIRAALAAHGAALPADRAEDWVLQLNGVGVHAGADVVVDVEQQTVYGAVFDVAYRLGEDVCAGAELLLTALVRDAVRDDPYFRDATFERRSDGGGGGEAEGAPLFAVGGAPGPMPDLQVPIGEARHTPAALMPLLSRHDEALPPAALAELDAGLQRAHMRPASVLMFEIVPTSAEPSAERAALRRRAFMRDSMRGVLRAAGGTELEDVLWTFESPAAAVAAAVAGRAAVARGREHATCDVRGWGVHHGSLLLVPGTDVHWGDPVNTASKLGQDIASDGQILISDAVFRSLSQLDVVRPQPPRSRLT